MWTLLYAVTVMIVAALALLYGSAGDLTVVKAGNPSRPTGDRTASASTSTVKGGIVVPKSNVDFNGDGRSDYVVTRATTTPFADAGATSANPGYDPEIRRTPGERRAIGKVSSHDLITPPIYWYIEFSGSANIGIGQLGDAGTDILTPEDFDGDGKDDLAVWTEAGASQANFKILQSTTNTIRVEFFGQTGDDPQIVGDYDGDGKADPAVYRCPPIGGASGQCYFFFRGSLNNPSGNVTYVPWGFGTDGDFFPYIGDFDGDGKNDFCVQRSNPVSPANSQFILLKSNGLGIEYIDWGLFTDVLVPGDYDGDGKTDFCVRRTVGNNRQHWIRYRTGASAFAYWGIAGDISAPGDYDGDGKTDIAIWRPSPDSSANYFWVLNAATGAVSQFEWGQCPTPQTCDYPAANWLVH
jgi:hypothetical protein